MKTQVFYQSWRLDSGIAGGRQVGLLLLALEALIKHIEPEDQGFSELGGAIGELSG